MTCIIGGDKTSKAASVAVATCGGTGAERRESGMAASDGIGGKAAAGSERLSMLSCVLCALLPSALRASRRSQATPLLLFGAHRWRMTGAAPRGLVSLLYADINSMAHLLRIASLAEQSAAPPLLCALFRAPLCAGACAAARNNGGARVLACQHALAKQHGSVARRPET